MDHYLIIVTGPTAVGKTDLCIELATCLQTEIISADARQCYQKMAIGTAQPTLEQQQKVKHHFINCFPIKHVFNASLFEKEALPTIEQLFKWHQYVIVTGGSGLYLKALCEGLDVMPPIPSKLRDDLQQRYQQEGLDVLREELSFLDPIYFQQMDAQNPRRILRALEICLATNKTYTYFRQKRKQERPFKIIKIGLHLGKQELYQRINLRVDQMFEQGLMEEAKALYPHRQYQALQTVGYKELFSFFDKQINLEEAMALIKKHTRHYAKRQLTWLNNQEELRWFHHTDYKAISDYIIGNK